MNVGWYQLGGLLMKKEFYLAFLLHSLIITASIINIITTRAWLLETGFIQISETPIYMMSLSCFSSGATIFFMIIFYHRRYWVFPVISAILSLPFLSVEFYFAYVMKFDTIRFLEQLIPTWANKHASAEVLFLQKRFKCCGYISVTDFPSVECQMGYCTPCIQKIEQALGEPLKGNGVFILSNALVRSIAIILFFVAYSEEDDPTIIDPNDPLVS